MNAFGKTLFRCLTALVVLLAVSAFDFGSPSGDTLRMGFRSVAAHDGYIWESAEDSGVGLRANSTDTIFRVGDDNRDRQYVGILSFNTSALPDNAIITWARVRIQQGDPAMIGWPGFGFEIFEVKSPYFGASPTLLPSDFQEAASAQLTGQGIHVNQYLTKLFGAGEFQYINLQGYTQIRVRLSVDDNDDMSADYRVLYTGNHPTPISRPTLMIEFQLP